MPPQFKTHRTPKSREATLPDGESRPLWPGVGPYLLRLMIVSAATAVS